MNETQLLLEALIDKLGYDADYEAPLAIVGGQIVQPARYRLISREPTVNFPINGAEWSAICEYVLAHTSDIDSDINDFGTLKPVLDYFNRNC